MNILYVFCLILTPVTKVNSQEQHDMLESNEKDTSSDASRESIVHRPKAAQYQFYTDGSLRKYFAMETALLDDKSNMLCSPVAALLPLGKLAYGARGSTRDELLEATGIKSKHDIGVIFREIIENLRYMSGVKLYMASRIYVHDDVRIFRKFSDRCQKTFNSDITRMNFRDRSSASAKINKWISDNTNGKISNVMSPDMFGKDTSMVIVNAIYFRGEWRYPFNRAILRDFFSPHGVRKIPMMSRNGMYDYGTCDNLQAELIEIPYKDKEAVMIIVLPYAKNGLNRLLRLIRTKSIYIVNAALHNLSRRKVLVTIPKFQMSQEIDLGALYRTIGVKRIFRKSNSDISKIVKREHLWVSEATQVTHLHVNERGSSVSDGHHDENLNIEYKQTMFMANRPFLFYIQGDGEQLFAGIYCGTGIK